MRTILRVFVFASLAARVSAGDSPNDLVKKLGHPSFRVRSDAEVKLTQLGTAAIPVLAQGTKHSDAEVAERCKKLLDQAKAVEQKEKLDQLFRDPTAAAPKGLAGAEQFFKVTGDSSAARELFVDLMRQHHEAMMTREKDAKLASEMLLRKGEVRQDR